MPREPQTTTETSLIHQPTHFIELTPQELRSLQRLQRELAHARQSSTNEAITKMAFGLGVIALAGLLGLMILAVFISILRPSTPPAPQINPGCVAFCSLKGS